MGSSGQERRLNSDLQNCKMRKRRGFSLCRWIVTERDGKSLMVGFRMGQAEVQVKECGCHSADHGELPKFQAGII